MLTKIENATRVVLVFLIICLVAAWLRPVVVDLWQWTRTHTSRRVDVAPPMTAPLRPSSSNLVRH